MSKLPIRTPQWPETEKRERARLPALSKAEALSRDLEAVTAVASALMLAIRAEDAEALRSAVNRAELLMEEDGAAGLLHGLSEFSRRATRREVAAEVTMLLAAFPKAHSLDQAFGRILAEDVAAQQPTIGALENACRKLRRSSRFVPSVFEVLEALTDAETRLANMPRWIERLPTLLLEAKTAYQREAIRRDRSR